MKTLRPMFSSLALALLALLANPVPVALAQLAIPQVAAPVPRISTISGTGRGQSITAADAQASANLAAERTRLTRQARGPIRWGSITTSRTLIPGWWPFYQPQYQTIMTQTWSY
ncbi:MAG: hypothetical protein NTX70_04775 [Verrucomicrobia bacterium]|nr:hypothetical protein [Verrucomicrobiota bacterium]